MRKILNLLLVPVLLSCLCLSAGYWVGKNPQYYQKYLDLSKSEILFYIPQENSALVPEAFQKEILKTSNFKVRFISTDPDAADILLVDQNYLKNRKANLENQGRPENSKWQDLFRQISPDFQRDLYKNNKAIPVLWSVDNNHLMVMSLIVDTDQGKRSATLWNFVDFLMNDKTYSHWLGFHHWNTTLLRFDEGGLSESRKASSIRKFNLNSIGINN